ncbi:MAG: glycosyltransferase family 2 protein [Alistipes sp.]|nr:glycosyltransferase family 2 protein [Alistipes sp.]
MALSKVIILNWNGAAVLPRFLPSVVANTPPDVEVVVTDNGSTDGSVELLRRDFPGVRLVTLDRNHGFAGGYNRALEAIEADNYILLNSDVETPPGWCEPLVEMLATHPKVAAVAPKILSWANRDTFEYAGASGGFIDALGYPFCRGRILDTVERDSGQYDDAREIFWATGACLACRADVFHDLGGFDGSFFAHQEEIDLCWRMQLAGWKVMVEPRSAVYHLGAGTLPPSPQKLYLNYRNNLAMLHKNLPSASLLAVIAARLALNILASTVYLARGEVKNFTAVHRAHRDYFRMIRDGLSIQRRQIQSHRIASPEGIYRGSILLNYLFGLRRFSQLKRL